MNTKIIKLDINKKMFETITAKQGDTKSRFILFNLYDGPIQFDLTGRTVRVYGKKKDNTTIFNDLVVNDAKKGYCTLELTNQMLAVEGMNELELVIFEGEKRLSTMPFILNVIGSKYSEDAIVSTNEFTALMNALKTVGDIDNKAEKKEVEKLSEQLDTKAKETDLLIQKNRIDSFTSLTEGSTTGDAELIDGRIGADGIVYSNIGEANRTQFAALNEFVYTSKKGTNVFQNVKVFSDTELSSSDGSTFTWSGISCSDFIPVDENTKYAFLNKNLTYIGVSKVCFYDNDKNYIGSGFTSANVGSYAYMENQSYIRFSCTDSTMSNIIAIQPFEENTYTYILSNDIKDENYIKKVDFDELIKPTSDKFEEKISILDEVTEIKYRNINNSEIEVGDLSSNGENLSNNSYLRTKSFIKVVGGKTIYLKKLKGPNAYDIFEYDEYYNFIKSTSKIYDYAQTNYTRTLQLSENTKYIKFKAWWTEPITDVKIAVYYDGCGIREYEDYTEPKVVIKGSSIDNSNNVPVICFNFDETNLDNRYMALQNAGFTGTWQFTKESLLYSKDVINTLIQNGHDISPYYGLSENEYHDTANHSANIAKMKEEVTKILNDMKKLGIYNPVMFSCSRHRGGYVVNEAIKDLKFKYVRCTWGVDQQAGDYYVSNLNSPDKKEQCPLTLTQNNTFEKIKTTIDNLISNGASLIMPMCHTLSYDNITEVNYFENLVAYIKTLSDKGIVKVMNMREYYEYHYPIQGEKDDRLRIMSNINDIKNLHLT